MTNASAHARSLARVLECVIRQGTITRAAIAATTGLSKATVARLVIDLKRLGLIETQSRKTSASGQPERPGRKPSELGVPSSVGHVIGLSLGLRSSHIVALDLSGQEQTTRLEATPPFRDQKQAMRWIADFITNVSSSLDASGPLLRINIALPGRVRDGLPISTLPEPLNVLSGQRVMEQLESTLGLPVILATDADMALAGVTSLGYIEAETAAVLFTMSTMLTVATRTEMGMIEARTASLGDFAALPPLVVGSVDEPVSVGTLLSVRGLLDYATRHGVSVSSPAELRNHEDPNIEFVRTSFAGALEGAIRVAAITADPEVCVLTGRLASLASSVLPELQCRLSRSLEHPPRLVVTGDDDNGLTTGRGSARTALALEQRRLVDEVREGERG